MPSSEQSCGFRWFTENRAGLLPFNRELTCVGGNGVCVRVECRVSRYTSSVPEFSPVQARHLLVGMCRPSGARLVYTSTQHFMFGCQIWRLLRWPSVWVPRGPARMFCPRSWTLQRERQNHALQSPQCLPSTNHG